MTKNDDILNYEAAKYNPVDDFRKFYDIQEQMNPKNNKPETRSSIDVLRDFQKSNPEALNAMQNMTIGFDDARIAKKAAMKKPSTKIESHEIEMISKNSEEFKTLTKNIADIQAEFDSMKDSGGFK